MKDKLWSEAEMEYLVRLSMEGLKRLTAQGDFTRPACVQRAMREYEIENNPVIGFLTEYENPKDKPTLEVYRDFQDWCICAMCIDSDGLFYCVNECSNFECILTGEADG